MFCGGCAALQYSGVTGRLLKHLTDAQVAKFPTLISNLQLFVVFGNIWQLEVIAI
jgi:hypothetical protein